MYHEMYRGTNVPQYFERRKILWYIYTAVHLYRVAYTDVPWYILRYHSTFEVPQYIEITFVFSKYCGKYKLP